MTATDNADGTVTVVMGTHTLVKGDESDQLALTKNNDGTVAVKWQSTNTTLDTTTGLLMASVHNLNGSGPNVQSPNEEPQRGIPYYKDQMDTFARALADVANNTIPQLGEDGKPAVDPDTGKILYKTLLGSEVTAGTTDVTAGNIKISDEWTNGGPGYFIFSKDEHVEDYAQQLASKLTDQSYTFTSNGESFSGTFMDFQVNTLGRLGADISFSEGRHTAYATIADDFLNQRDSISGVSSDEETSDLIKYQKSYEAASRVMTVLDELLDVVINRMGRAGL